MNKLTARFGKLIAASFFVMAIGIVVFLLAIPLYSYFRIDTDIIGLFIFTTGLAILDIGLIHRYNLHGWKMAVLLFIAIVLCLPVLLLIVSSIYYLITGKPLGG